VCLCVRVCVGCSLFVAGRNKGRKRKDWWRRYQQNYQQNHPSWQREKDWHSTREPDERGFYSSTEDEDIFEPETPFNTSTVVIEELPEALPDWVPGEGGATGSAAGTAVLAIADEPVADGSVAVVVDDVADELSSSEDEAVPAQAPPAMASAGSAPSPALTVGSNDSSDPPIALPVPGAKAPTPLRRLRGKTSLPPDA
jgi:hypothetical protein